MKTIKHLCLAIVLATATIFTSCSSSDGDGGGGGGASAGTVQAKVGGSNFKSMTAASFAMNQSGILVIQGSDATGKAIQLMLTGVTTAGTYQISNSGISVIANYTISNISNPMASQVFAAPYEGSGVAGSITISEITASKVVGTFEFTGKLQNGADTKQITNGAFNVNFRS